METRVALERESQVCSVRRNRALIVGQLRLGRERKPSREFVQTRHGRARARPRKFSSVERIGRNQRAEQAGQLSQLRRGDFRAGGKGIIGRRIHVRFWNCFTLGRAFLVISPAVHALIGSAPGITNRERTLPARFEAECPYRWFKAARQSPI